MKEIIAELDREIGLRESAYPKWVQEGRLDKDLAETRIKALKKASAILKRIDERGGLKKLGLAYELLDAINERPGGLAALGKAIGSDFLQKLAEVFPDAKIAGAAKKEEPAEAA